MVLWRISRHRDLAGVGALRAPGRWHHAGRPVVYLAETPAAALLEVCVHTSANDVPPDFTLLRIEGPETASTELIAPADLPADWRVRVEVTRDLGSAWLERGKSVLLRVPSALVPKTTNYLLNPSHPEAPRFRVAAAYDRPFDSQEIA